jgi:LacI family transcriptional regulator
VTDAPLRLPTIREVAREAGVSPMTVSRVLTGRGYVSDGTAERVRAVLDRLRYRPNSAARLLRGRRSHIVGVTIPSLTSSVHRGIVGGLEEALGPAEYQLLLGHLQAGGRRASSFLDSVRRQHCDGFVIVPSRADADGAPLARLYCPAVAALSSIPNLIADRVLADGRLGAYEATRFLLERFGGPAAFVGLNSRLSHDLSIVNGYRQAVREAGHDLRELFVDSGGEVCRDGMRALLADPRPPRGFLFASSLVGFEGVGELVQSGRVVGRDVGVVAVASEERPWTALLPTPPALLIIPAREIGRRAGELLLRRLGDEPIDEPETVVVPMQFEEGPAATLARRPIRMP